MKNQEQYKRLIRAGFCAVLLLMQAGLFWYVWKNGYSVLMQEPYERKGHWLIMGVYLSLIFIFGKIYGGWKVGFQRTFHIIYSQCLGILFSDILMYLLITLLTKHFENPGMLFSLMLVQMAVINIWGIFCTHIYQKAYPPRRVILIYGERPAAGLMKKIHTRADRFEVGEMVHISKGIEEIERRILEYEGAVICDIPSRERNLILKYCYGKGIRAYTMPKLSDLIIRSAESLHMFDTPLLLSRNNGLTIEQRAVKRFMDIIFSLMALIPAIPVMAVVAFCIKAEDGGAVLYHQKRLTQDGKEFYVHKFRSMVEDAEKDGTARLAGANDARITRVGHVIRAVRLDELPQLFNILAGDMGIVGPRPERPEIAAAYEKTIPEFSYRLKVKAGLTGYAQVYGKYNTNAFDKLKLDLMYIQNYSIRLDFEIMIKTVQILFLKESTEGLEEGQFAASGSEKQKSL